MTEKCRVCNEEIRKVSNHWMHVDLNAQIASPYGIHKPQPLVTMVESNENVIIYKDV
jgi:hypothetical protein